MINLLAPTPIGFIKQQAHAGIQYEAPLSGGGSLTPRFDVTYQGPQNGSNSAAAAGSPTALYGQVAGFTVANAHLEWRNAKKDLSARLEATNLFNKYYFYSKFDLSSSRGNHHRLARAAVWLGADREEELLIPEGKFGRVTRSGSPETTKGGHPVALFLAADFADLPGACQAGYPSPSAAIAFSLRMRS